MKNVLRALGFCLILGGPTCMPFPVTNPEATTSVFPWLVAEATKFVHFGCLQRCRTYYHKAAKVTEPFAQGRRVWLFAQTQQCARASANLYSLVSCARVNGLESCAYLRHLFEELSKATTAEALEALLPWNIKPLLPAAA